MNEIMRDERVIAMEIIAIKGQARAMLVTSAIEIGRRLAEAKAIVPYGGWTAWLRDNVDYSERTAQNLMRCWEEYGKKDRMTLLEGVSLTNAVALLGASPEQRTELLESGEAAALSTRELEKRVAELKAESEARQTRIEDLLAEAEAAEAKVRVAEEAMERASAAQDAARQAEEEREALREKLAKAKEKAEAEKQRAADWAGKAKAAEEKAKAAEARAAEAEAREPERIEIEKRVEVIPEAVSEELSRLRDIAAKAPDENVIRVRDGYARALKEFEAIKGILDAMEAGEAAKYRKATAAGLRKMAEAIDA